MVSSWNKKGRGNAVVVLTLAECNSVGRSLCMSEISSNGGDQMIFSAGPAMSTVSESVEDRGDAS